MRDWTQPTCGELGPPPFPRGRGYRCSRELDHAGVHRAHLGDRVLDTWPQRDEVTTP